MIQPLSAVKVRCTDCGATHVKPERVDREDPPETMTGKCYAPHPSRGAEFEGCGKEDADLEVVEVNNVE